VFLTVTANTALDRILFIPKFETGTTMRTVSWMDAVGGKGCDVSVALRCLEQETLAVAWAAGKVGRALSALMAQYGIEQDLIWVEGETRIAHVIVENELNRHSHISTSGYQVSEADMVGLLSRVEAHLDKANWVVAAGSLPGGAPTNFYQTLSTSAHKRHIPILIDASEAPLRAALSAKPDVVKLNQAEFRDTFSIPPDEDLTLHASRIYQDYHLSALVITCGMEGLLAFTPTGAYQAQSPQLPAINAAGAGDACSAALITRLHLGDSWEEALRWAAAAGAATVLTRETAVFELTTVRELLRDTKVTTI